jgi:hypothetical protein
MFVNSDAVDRHPDPPPLSDSRVYGCARSDDPPLAVRLRQNLGRQAMIRRAIQLQ